MAVVFSTKCTRPASSHLSTSRRPNPHPELPSFHHFSPSNYCSFRKPPISAPPLSSGCSPISCSSSTATSSSPSRYFEIDEGSPWEGVVVYRYDPSVARLECCTTLESPGVVEALLRPLQDPGFLYWDKGHQGRQRLPLGHPCAEIDGCLPQEEEVEVGGDHQDRHHSRLQQVLFFSLFCSKNSDSFPSLSKIAFSFCSRGRRGRPATKCVFSDFQLLLLQNPIEALDNVFVGSFYGDQVKRRSSEGVEEEDDDGDMVDFDDRLYFPVEEKVIDISKPIRDTIHVEIAINEVCSPACKGVCLQWGVNLNRGPCRCGTKQGVFRSVAVTEKLVS